jgi:hypothetical protein
MKPVPKTILSLFFLIFGGMGLLFALLLLRESAGAIGMRLWPRVPVEIAASGGRLLAEAAPDEPPFRFEVRYRYEFEGTAYESQSLAPGGNNFFVWAEVARNEKLYPPAGARGPT